MKSRFSIAKPGFFDLDNRFEPISILDVPLAMFEQAIPGGAFRLDLMKSMSKFKKTMCVSNLTILYSCSKILVLQSLYNLSDDQTEFQIIDRLSFMRFLRFDFVYTVPDEKPHAPLLSLTL
jgi:transposase, IS5 family